MGALSNLRVLDLTQVLAGPYCTMLLADMGADVVKIERPGGDMIRSFPPFVADSEKEAYGGYFQSVNRGKKSIELNLGDETDRDDFLSLVEEADIVVENYRAGTMEKYDLGYETLTEYNENLIYSSIRGFGDPRTGETDRQGQPSFDLIAQALGGVMETTGQPDGPPTKTGPGVGDLFTATLNCIGILAAVNHREQTGEGQYVDTGMYDSMISFTERAIYQQSYSGEAPSRRGNSHPTLFPYNAFETADGYAVIAAFNNNHWAELCEIMGREDLSESYPTTPERLENREILRDEIANWTLEQTNEELVGKLEGRVPAAKVQTTEEIFEDEHVRIRDMLVPVEQPGADRDVEIAGNPIKMSETTPQPRGRAPLLDEHREEILGEEAETTADD
ncbi:succinate--mesaconate CoA-transferase [Natronorubrum sediminis]|uniref:Succinate--mesaconate CoA-transferase n=1 Tax=Natronorubrum sediminis TaxID=640943 RepID=A0A1H6FJZ1_9EURY|nr:succinyl-CoA:mesaconate CoA-transferase [Natronorubrum sediminis]SEH11179.1 succinate--mesaconate CoA-transferase [Natronorubrum sediminis]